MVLNRVARPDLYPGFFHECTGQVANGKWIQDQGGGKLRFKVYDIKPRKVYTRIQNLFEIGDMNITPEDMLCATSMVKHSRCMVVQYLG